jgi:hypothetical protein
MHPVVVRVAEKEVHDQADSDERRIAVQLHVAGCHAPKLKALQKE